VAANGKAGRVQRISPTVRAYAFLITTQA
jgi:hypothetical protein